MSDYSLSFAAGDKVGGNLIVGGSVRFDNAAEILAEGEQLLTNAGLLSASRDSSESSLAGCVTIDVSQVEGAQSVLLSLVLRWLDRLLHSGYEASVVGLSAKMLKMAEVTGLDAVLPIQQQ